MKTSPPRSAAYPLMAKLRLQLRLRMPLRRCIQPRHHYHQHRWLEKGYQQLWCELEKKVVQMKEVLLTCFSRHHRRQLDSSRPPGCRNLNRRWHSILRRQGCRRQPQPLLPEASFLLSVMPLQRLLVTLPPLLWHFPRNQCLQLRRRVTASANSAVHCLWWSRAKPWCQDCLPRYPHRHHATCLPSPPPPPLPLPLPLPLPHRHRRQRYQPRPPFRQQLLHRQLSRAYCPCRCHCRSRWLCRR